MSSVELVRDGDHWTWLCGGCQGRNVQTRSHLGFVRCGHCATTSFITTVSR